MPKSSARRRRRSRFRSRRTGFPDSRQHQAGGRPGARAELHQVHAGGRHRRAEEGRLRAAHDRISAPTTSPPSASSRWAASTSSSTSRRRWSIPGDEVVIPVPYWVTYKDVVNYAGGKCVFVETDEAAGLRADGGDDRAAPDGAHQHGDHQFALEPQRRGGGPRRVREDLPPDVGARHLPDDRRVLLQVPVRQRAVLDRLAAGREGDGAGGRLALEDLCHDRMAHRLRPGAGADRDAP